jgi:3-demethoxyubiquinol 3-hydroxylase
MMSYKHLFALSTDCVKQELVSIARVNHSGELGAKYIYKGQIIASKFKQDSTNEADDKTLKLIDMYKSELAHLEYFETLIKNHSSFKFSLLNSMWKPFSFGLGFCSAFASYKLAMLLTKCVETVIESHYLEQLIMLEKIAEVTNNQEEKELCLDLKQNIYNFLQDEIEHKIDGDTLSQGLSLNTTKICSFLFESIVKCAILISKKI